MQTFQDAIDLLVDYLGGNPTDTVQRDCRRAVLEAYRDLTNAFRWSYLLRHGRLITVPPQSAGTVSYVDATRTLTLTPAPGDPVQSWPAWAPGSYVRVGQVAAKAVRVLGPTALLLDEDIRFGVDIAAGAEYRLFRDSYLLPRDFVAQDQALYENNFGGMEYVHPREWLFRERYVFSEGTPQAFTVTGDGLYPGRLVVRMVPLPSEARTIDYLYHRAPRPLVIARENAGTASYAGGSTVTGSGTAWHAGMVGSVLRLSATSASPTSAAGKNPAAFEGVIMAVDSPTALTVAEPAPVSLAGVAYVISDLVDIEEQSMGNAFNRCCEMHISMNRTLKDKPSAALQYRTALTEARAADSRSFSGRSVGDFDGFPMRLRDRGPLVLNQE
jgi:hypothetical protein